MSDKLFVKQTFQPPGMGWALIVSIGFILVAVVASWWANGPVTGLYFVLTEYGWKTDPNNSREVIHPVAQKIALTARYLTVIPPLISLFWGITRRGLSRFRSSKLLENHTVVCGLGWQGRSFIKSLHARGEHLGLHVVDEAGSRLAAIHHPGQAVLAFLANKKLRDIKFC